VRQLLVFFLKKIEIFLFAYKLIYMLIVIPVSNTDEDLIEDFCSIVNKLGPYSSDHEAVVVTRPSDLIYGHRVYSLLRKSFEKIHIYSFPSDGERGWPDGPNFYWYSTIQYLKEIGNTQPWLWMELDMTPLCFNWVEQLESEYASCGKKCLGWTQNTTTVTKGGKLVALDRHLVGAAVYPPDLHVITSLWQYVHEISTAFDVICQSELVPMTHHSTLFQHCFRTENYRQEESGIIRGDDNNDFPDGLRFDKPLQLDAVIHHGCTDGSLARILVAKPNSEFLFKKKVDIKNLRG
jgi:hypothetical protein